MTITSLRIFIAAIVVWFILWVKKEIRLPNRKEFLFILLASFTGMVVNQHFLSVGLTMTTASNTGLILGTIPLTTSFLASIMLKDRLSLFRIIGLLIAIAVIAQALSFIFIKQTSATIKASLITGYCTEPLKLDL